MALGESFSSPFGSHELKTSAAVFVLTLFAVKLVTMVNKKLGTNFPPGPRGLPLLGYLPFFGKEPPVTFNELRKTYGDVIGISMGSWPAIVINGRDAIKEALVTKGDDFSGRPAFVTAQLLNEGRNFGFSAFGPLWKMHRKIVSNVMYTFTNARNNPIEDIILTEAKTVIEDFLAHKGESFDPLDELQVAASSMVFQLCYGEHLNIREDESFMSALAGSKEFTKFTRAGNPVDVMPWVRFIMPSKVTKFLALIKGGTERREKKVKEHVATYDEENLRDITDGLIHAADHLTPEEKAVGLDKQRIIESLDTIFGAGGGTVSSTLQWCVYVMAAYPEKQEKLFQQVNEVVGHNRDARLSDRAALPLVEATIYEVLRFCGSVPFALPHATVCDTTLRGYDIPEGTVVMINLQSIYMDKEFWGDPEVFRPERFITSEGLLDRSLVEQTYPFSLGRRRCVGEFLARMELFVFFTTLIQRIRFFKPPGQPDYKFESMYGLTRDVKPYQVCAAPRL